MHSFRSRILILIIGLVVGTQIVTLVAVSARIADDVRDQANDQLQAAGSVVGQLMAVRSGQLSNAVSVLAADFGFREAVTSADSATIVSAMDNQAERIHADLALVLDPDGVPIASTGSQKSLDPKAAARMMELRGSSRERPAFVVLGGKPYQIVVVPVRAPQLVAWVAMGFAVGDALAAEVRRLVGLDVAFVTTTATTRRVVGTTLPAFANATPAADVPRTQAQDTRMLRIGDEEWLSISRPLDPQDPVLSFVLLNPASVVMKPFNEARLAILMIGGTALVFALLAGVLLARGATQPVVELDIAARRIEEGDYKHSVALKGAREFQRLAQTFNSMQQRISDREQQLTHLAYHDAVTGLPNLRRAEQEIDQQTRRSDEKFTVIVLELAALEDVRATLGDAFFDGALCCIAALLNQHLRDDAFLARIGPYSFLMLLRGEAMTHAPRIAARICESLRHGIEVEQVRVVLDGVAGLALTPEHGRGSAELMRRALMALHSAKQHGETVAQYRPGSDEQFRRRLELSAALPAAIEEGEITLVYQPKMNMQTRQVVGAEALVRWNHPQFGAVSPSEFVPLAERTGAIRELTRHALRAAVQQLSAWRARGFKLDLSVNISAADIIDPELASLLLMALRRAAVPTTRLILEITETAVMHDRAAAARHMEMLRVAGIRFSIDDFGTGHSSLSLLQALPVDELKIDKQFVADLETNADSAKIVQSTVELARALGLKVVAEGIETESIWDVLAGFGCHLGQGFLISKPLPADEFVAYVLRTNAPAVATDETQQMELSLMRVVR